jgi:hypothetical protein
MAGQRDPHTQIDDERPAGILGDRLRLMFEWFKGGRSCSWLFEQNLIAIKPAFI